MKGSLKEFIPHPFAFGTTGRPKLPVRRELHTVKEEDTAVISKAKIAVSHIAAIVPEVLLTPQELQVLKPNDLEALYAHPAASLIYKSPHNMRHFAAMDILSLFIGKYANSQLIRQGIEPLNLEALRYSAWTHDSFRSRFDILGTTFNYQLHGIRASENLETILQKGGLPQPSDSTRNLTEEIDRYHDVDDRPKNQRSREVELFTIVDKLEMVRLFHPIQIRFRLPLIAQGVHTLARKRMRAYEGSHAEFMGITGDFLQIVDGLYRLSMQHINTERRKGKSWKDINQYEAVFTAAEELGIISESSAVATRRSPLYSNSMGIAQAERVQPKPNESLRQILSSDIERKFASQIAIQRLREKAGEALPTKEYVARYATTPDMFANSTQVESSLHNIRHHAGVAVGTVLITTDVTVNHPEVFERVGLTPDTAGDLLLRVAMVHDTQRMKDSGESWPTDVRPNHWYDNIAQHGKKIADLASGRITPQNETEERRVAALRKMTEGLLQDQADLVLAMVAYHDVPFWKIRRELAKNPSFSKDLQKQQQVLTLLDMFKIADNMEMVRFFYEYRREHLNGGKGSLKQLAESKFVNHRLFHNKPYEKELQGINDTYTPVIAELFQRSNGFVPVPADKQFPHVLDIASDMGIFLLRQTQSNAA